MSIFIGKYFIVLITLFSNHIKQAMVTINLKNLFVPLEKPILYYVGFISIRNDNGTPSPGARNSVKCFKYLHNS